MDTYSGSSIGRNIVPSARESIHRHRITTSVGATRSDTMVRYGVDDGVDEVDQGVDVVDNAMSKLSQPITPTMFRKKKNISVRRKSLNDEHRNYTEDDSNMLSKSVPASFPPRPIYSDYSEDENISRQNQSNEDRIRHGTPASFRNRSGSSASLSHFNESNEYLIPQSKKNYQPYIILFTILSVIVAFISHYAGNIYINETKDIIYDEYKFHKEINALGRKYNVGQNALIQVQSGISTIYQRKDTGSFMFVYNTNEDNFDTNKFNQFMNDVSFAASQYLRNDSTPVRYTIVEGYDLDMKDHGELIDKFRNDLENSGLMLVKHIEAIPSELAMAFHYYCDEYNPLVTKSAIFFTLNLAKCSTTDTAQKSIHATIEKCLSKKWNSVSEDSISPLLTRVVSIVIDVTKVFAGK